MRAIANRYRDFERGLIKLLRDFDSFRDPGQISWGKDQVPFHEERVQAFQGLHLEEVLYPCCPWLVPLFSSDDVWQHLLPLLRTIEGMMLHNGPLQSTAKVPGTMTSVGREVINQVRVLGYEASKALEELVTAGAVHLPTQSPCDPLIDPDNEEATKYYLTRMVDAIRCGDVALDQLPDRKRFQEAVGYYGIHTEYSLGL